MIESNSKTVGHYGGGLHWSDVAEEDKIPFQKVSKSQPRAEAMPDPPDHLRHHGHVRTNSLPHKNLSTLDHDTSIQPLPKMRHLYQSIHGNHVGILYPSRYCQSPNLQPYCQVLESGN